MDNAKETLVAETLDRIIKTTNSSSACVAAAVIHDNHMLPMSPHEQTLLARLAYFIETLMVTMDEPRFTLYDYLDAVVNNLNEPWPEMAQRLLNSIYGKNGRDTACTTIVEMAERKRETYSS